MQPVDEDELANTQQGPEEAGSQNSVPLSQRETQPWRLDVAGDRDGAAFRPPVGLESGVQASDAASIPQMPAPSKAPAFGRGALQHPLQEEARLERAPTNLRFSHGGPALASGP